MPQHADLIFAGGAVYTPDGSGRRLVPATLAGGRRARAVAVAGGVIAAVGAGDLAALRGPGTEVVSLRGRALLPGLQDAHAHPAFAGVTMTSCNLIGAATLAEAEDRIRACAAAHQDREWISGSGWRMDWLERGTPSRHHLDELTGGRPAFLLNREAHGGWASTRALEMADLDARSPDPPDGRFERDQEGVLQGTAHEGTADLIGAVVPEPSFADRMAGLLLAQRHLHQRGITAWQDAIVGAYLGSQDPLPAYLEAARSGRLTARVQGARSGGTAAGARTRSTSCSAVATPGGPGGSAPAR
jgi:predicted amidohydrolase YtcJ